jgi:hypothetical protein
VPVSLPHKAEARKTFVMGIEKVGNAVLVVLAATSSRA